MDDRGLMYHARLVGQKGDLLVSINENSCCEGQGTRLLGSLPEFLYSVVPDGPGAGLYVDMYAPSTIRWQQSGDSLQPDHENELSRQRRCAARAQAGSAATVCDPGAHALLGSDGDAHSGERENYDGDGPAGKLRRPVDRTWQPGDTVAFALPMTFKLTRYTGMDKIPGHERYALEYGPILLAIEGSDDARLLADVAKGERFREAIDAEVRPAAVF